MRRAGRRAAVRLDFGRAMRALFFVDQSLPVRDRDLVVVGMDFAECEKSVPVATVIDKGRLQRRLDPRNLGEIDVAT